MSQTDYTGPVYIRRQSELFQTVRENSSGKNGPEEIFQRNKNRLLIEASAGTGKTFTLVELVLELMLTRNIPLKSILIVTFTDKATTELRLRLRTKLREISDACENKLSEFQNVPEGSHWEINKVQRDQVKAALLDFDSVPVYTIHGFCKRILQEFAFENRQLFDQQLADNNLLFPEVFRRYLRKELLSNNNPVSRLFSLYVKQSDGYLHNLESEIKNLLPRRGKFVPMFPSFEVFLREFSELWKVLAERDLRLHKDGSAGHPIISAFNATALNGTSKKNIMLNLELLLQTLSDWHTVGSIEDVFYILLSIELDKVTRPKCRQTLRGGEKWLSPQEFPKAELDWISAVADCEKLFQRHNLVGEPGKILRAWVIQKVLGNVRSALRKTKMEQGIFDYDDLLHLVEEQVNPRENSTTPTALTKVVREKYACAVVDEFQDTDHRQWNIFRKIFLESPEHNLIVIGDPKQAIYSFRGADIFTYMQARRVFAENYSQAPVSLTKNFRSSELLLCGLNHIFGSSYWLPEEKGLEYINVGCGKPELELKDLTNNRSAVHLLELLPQFTVSGKKLADQSRLQNPGLSEGMLNALYSLNGQRFYGKDALLKSAESAYGAAVSASDKNVVLELFLDDQAELATSRFADAIALEIKKLLAKGSPERERPVWKNEAGENYLREQDICVLFRKASEGEKIGKALRACGISFAFYKQKGLFAGREARDIYDLLEAINHPNDHSRTAKVRLTRFFGINIQDLAERSFDDSDLTNLLHEWKALAESRQFRKMFDQILLRTRMVERELFLSGDERSVTNYTHLFEVLIRQVLENHLDLHELSLMLKRFIDGQEDPGENENLLRLESERNAVQLMTIHASKGLEFPVVFLFGGLTANKKDSIHFYHDEAENPVIDFLSRDVPEEFRWQLEAEKQRLLYVAMTRACARLYLPYVGFIEGNAGRPVCKVSGDYAVINDRLTTIDSGMPGVRGISPFSRSLCGQPVSGLEQFFEVEEQKKLTGWEIPKLSETQGLLDKVKNVEESLAQLRRKKRGFAVSSFSGMSSRKEEQHATETAGEAVTVLPVEIRTESQLNERREDDEHVHQQSPDTEDESNSYAWESNKEETKNDLLPGGTQTGNMMHELLEHLDFETIRISTSPQNWLEQPLVRTQIDSIRERHQRSEETVPVIAEIIWSTMHTPVRLGIAQDSEQVELAYCEQNLREADFYFPIPSNGSLKSKDSEELKKEAELILGEWNVDKGFLRGSIDFVFEHKGRIYLIDWKSNTLADYHPKTLENEVMKRYMLQLQIYTLATSYWFKLDTKEKFENRFGGVLYIFLRGMPQKEGVFFFRPGWNDLLDYEKRLSLEIY